MRVGKFYRQLAKHLFESMLLLQFFTGLAVEESDLFLGIRRIPINFFMPIRFLRLFVRAFEILHTVVGRIISCRQSALPVVLTDTAPHSPVISRSLLSSLLAACRASAGRRPDRSNRRQRGRTPVGPLAEGSHPPRGAVRECEPRQVASRPGISRPVASGRDMAARYRSRRALL